MPKKSAPNRKRAQGPRAGAKAAAGSNGKKKATPRSAKKTAARGAAARKKVEPVPQRYGTVTPHLIVSPCAAAIDFYVKAFGAKVLGTMPGPGGLIMHGEIKIGDSIIMLADEQPSRPGMPERKTPKNAGATTAGVMLYVKDVDSVFQRAVDAGAKPAMPPEDMFWGDRYGQLEDPFGHVWAVATHLRDMTAKQMQKAMAAAMSASEA